MRRVISSLILLGFLLCSFFTGFALALEELPSGVVNVARPEFGSRVGGGSDYGLANDRPVEVVRQGGGGMEIRMVRTPIELRLSTRNEARFQVKIGDTNLVYFWMEAPRVHGQWHVKLTAIYPDQYRKVIFSRNLRNRVTNFTYVDPRTHLEIEITSIEQTFKLSKRFAFMVTPERFWTWPDHLPIPQRYLWE